MGLSVRGLVRFAAAGAAALLLLLPRQGESAETPSGPPDQPIARIAGTAHSGLIKKVDLSSDGQIALSVSDDKTARVWDLSNPGLARPRLLRTLRVPIGEGYEGQLYAGALSPNGQLAALGGYTALNWDGAASIYFMETQTGRMRGRLFGVPAGRPATIENLKFSRDGRLLAVTFWREDDRFILQVYDLSKLSEGIAAALVAEDESLGGRILGIDFAPTGDLTVASMGGTVRQYRAAEGYRRPQTLRIDAALEPMHVRYSPAATQLLIGMNSVPRIALVDARSLKVLRWLEPAGDSAAGLHVVEWSPDGRYAFAAGEPAGNSSRIYRWTIAEGTAGSSAGWKMADRRITDLYRVSQSGRDGMLLFSSADPTLGLMDVNGTEIWSERSLAADFRQGGSEFRVSEDGRELQFRVSAGDGNRLLFSTRTLDESALTRQLSERSDLRPARRSGERLRVDILDRNRVLNINGRRFALEDKEEVYGVALSQDEAQAFVGSSWAIRALNADGSMRWRIPTNSPVYQLALAPAAGLIVAGLGDGTIRWYRQAEGEEIAALFVAAQRGPSANAEWILWTPDGRYAASPQGDELIGWHQNRGKDTAARFFRAVQFERILYDPGAVLAALQPRQSESGSQSASHSTALSASRLAAIAPPEIWIEPSATPSDDPAKVALDVMAESTSLAMQSLTAYVNDLPVIPIAQRTIDGSGSQSLKRRLLLPLNSSGNEIRIEVNNGQSIGLADYWVQGAASVARPQRKLFVLAVGVSSYDSPTLPNLANAAKDAIDLQQKLPAAVGNWFDQVETRLIADGKEAPTAKAIRDALPFLASAGPEDTVVLFLAAHGVSSPKGDYFFVPKNARDEEVARALKGELENPTSLVGWQEFFAALSAASGRRLLIVDTCHSADIRGVSQTFSLAKRSAASRFALLAASKGDELSQEIKDQGVFTYAFLSALSSAPREKDGNLSLARAYEYILPLVERIRPLRNLPQTPQLIAPRSLLDMPVATTGGG